MVSWTGGCLVPLTLTVHGNGIGADPPGRNGSLGLHRIGLALCFWGFLGPAEIYPKILAVQEKNPPPPLESKIFPGNLAPQILRGGLFLIPVILV